MKRFVPAGLLIIAALAVSVGADHAVSDSGLAGAVEFTDSPSPEDAAERRQFHDAYLKISGDYARARIMSATTKQANSELIAETQLLAVRLELVETQDRLAKLEQQLAGWSNGGSPIVEGVSESLESVRKTKEQLASFADHLPPDGKRMLERFAEAEAQERAKNEAPLKP
jgi:hypothetical protein